MTNNSGSFGGLCAVGLLARFSYALARTPVLPLFALYLGAGPEVIGWVVGISTVTGIFFKLPAGVVSDWLGRRRTLFPGLIIFALRGHPAADGLERHFGTAMGAFGTIFDVGHAAGPILAGYLLLSFNYRQSFWVLSALLLLSIPIFLGNVRHEKRQGG